MKFLPMSKPKILSIDTRRLKTLIIHLNTRINLIQYFGSFFKLYLKIIHILETKLNS